MTGELIRPNQIDRFLVVRCASEFFLIDVSRVRRVVDNVSIHPSPFSVRGLLGLARFGGEPLTVFSLGALSGAGPGVRTDRTTMVVVRIGGTDPPQRLGLAVDEAQEIVSVDQTGLGEVGTRAVSPPFDLDGRQVRRFNVEVLGDHSRTGEWVETTQAKE